MVTVNSEKATSSILVVGLDELMHGEGVSLRAHTVGIIVDSFQRTILSARLRLGTQRTTKITRRTRVADFVKRS